MAGADVSICARKPEELKTTVNELGSLGHCDGVTADLSSSADRAELVDWVSSNRTKLDILVNNAGTAWGGELESFSEEGFEKVLRLNVTALFDLTRRLVPVMGHGRTAEEPGRIINIGSVDGLRVPSVGNYPYSASKAAVHMLTRHLARELVDKNINVNCIAPGLFPTKMTAHWFDETHPRHEPLPPIPMRRGGAPSDIAAAAVFLAAPASAYVTGVVLPVAGGVSTID
jgi:NAD(P)-dependent dehydrogenase (short-subunit alcohol dehydrogenase family)